MSKSTKEKVLELKSQGFSNTKICEILNITKSTVSFHCGSKRGPKKVCKCGNAKDSRSTLCSDCRKKFRDERPNLSLDSTIGDKQYTKHKYSKYSYIRWHARKTQLDAGFDKCANCGYDKHVEVAHIKAISSFPETATIREVNDSSNLISLCPNCHWELDYGDLTIESIIGATQQRSENDSLKASGFAN